MLLHVCCGPCSTSVAQSLQNQFKITAYFYNPNIFPYAEWLKRYEAFLEVAKRGYFVDFFPKQSLTADEYKFQHEKFLKAVKGFETEPEGSKRCFICFRSRLEETARFTKELGIDIFGTTLTIGRNKKAEIINPLGQEIAKVYGIKFFEADFKKHDGFLKSVKLSKEMNLYRQRYCGCEFSLR
jgi:predicted adenine nucleotide alpha hydrolase (AANH) superfamily ATPase